MKNWGHIIGFIIVFTSVWHGVQGQKSRAIAGLDSTTVLIGDQVIFSLELTAPAGSNVTWPMFNDTLVDKVEILRRSTVDTVRSDKEEFTLRQELLITSFDSGYYEIPPVPFRFHLSRDSTQYYTESRSVYLTVNTPEVDEAGDIKPIKPPFHAPLTFREVFPWLAGGLLAALLVAGIIFYMKRKKASQPVFQIRQKPKLPPHEVALSALDGLRHKKLWQAGRVKDYYTELTDIIRVYLEGRYDIRAMEMTTYEIEMALEKIHVPAASREKLYATLESADLVKFAKGQPLPTENDRNHSHCVEFVMETKPVADPRKEAAEDKTINN